MQRFFITGAGTGVGKTLVTAALAWQLRQEDKRVSALKPVISGYDPDDEQSDTALILKSCGIERAMAVVDAVSPWRYRLPLSPDMAAEKERKPPVNMEKLVAFCQDAKDDYILAEGIGGVMSPVNHRHTVLDWMAALGWPVILVAGSYLGTISHTLTALEALHARALTVKALVVSESASGVALDDTAASIKKFLLNAVPVVRLARITAPDPWKHVPSISGICA